MIDICTLIIEKHLRRKENKMNMSSRRRNGALVTIASALKKTMEDIDRAGEHNLKNCWSCNWNNLNYTSDHLCQPTGWSHSESLYAPYVRMSFTPKECVERGKHPHPRPLPRLPGVQFFLGRPNRRARTSWKVSRWPVQSIVRNLMLHPGPLGRSDFPNAWSANHYKGFSPPSPQEFTPNPPTPGL